MDRTAAVERSVARISPEPISPGELLAEMGGEEEGAILVFAGTVRRTNRGRQVKRLHYEAYVEMAEAELERIVMEAATRFPVGAVQAVHRCGTLEVGEASVVVAVASPHRAAAYEASRYVMEELKKRLPVWKREEYSDGTSRWLGDARPPSPGDEG